MRPALPNRGAVPSALLVLLVSFTMVVAPAQGAPPPFAVACAAPGGVIGSIPDARAIVEHVLGRAPLTGLPLEQADRTGDGVIDVNDVVWAVGDATPTPTPTAAPSPTPTPGVVRTITLPEGVTLDLLAIPPGSFEMGANDEPLWSPCHSCEQPIHTVTIAYEFYMGVTEVTQAQWEAVTGENPAYGYGVGPDYPAYQVSWNDIMESRGFIETLNAYLEATGQGVRVRLPSEAEWEYCCRAGTTTRFCFGDSTCVPTSCDSCELDDYAWWCGTNEPFGTKPVGGKLPNPWGLYDMHGNVWEWCRDDWHDDYEGAPTDGSPWLDDTAVRRVVRGGVWTSGVIYCRSANRDPDFPGYRGNSHGLRLAADPWPGSGRGVLDPRAPEAAP